MDFLTKKELPTKLVDAPTYSTFENVVTSVATLSKSFVVACVYRTPGSCSSAFLDDFLFFVVSYHLLLLPLLFVVTSTFMWIQTVSTNENF